MEKFQDVVIDPAGNALPGVTVEIKDFGTATKSTIYSDNAKTPLANPLTTDANGHFFFYAEHGRYDAHLSGGGVVAKVISDLWVDDVVYASINSPTFTGTPLAPTATSGDNSKQIATTEFVAALMTQHAGAANPHAAYLTKSEFNARNGGTVTQATDKTTAVSLNKQTGEVVTAGSLVRAGTSVAFQLNNTSIGANDNVVINVKSGASGAGVYQVWCETIAAGSCSVVIHNVSAADYSDTLKLQFTVLKGAIA